MKELIQFIGDFQHLDQVTTEAVKNSFQERLYKRNDYLLKEGETCSKIFFIKTGLVRRFYVIDGEEITKWIYHDNHWLTSLASYFNHKPSFECLQADQDTVVYFLSREKEQELLKFPLFLQFHFKFLRFSLAAFDEFHFVLDSMTAQKKYKYIIENFPLIIQRAKQKNIASLLNVSQETLSRIRAGIY
ncbi:Crp/Fnr family transcriptional regulator [Algoriphagus sp. Y33]|uniref:Crp/Fnr family transcriptional regulator n=1 Tax=Algoriphagus sp. Y33 TaxID=2772483 RepID=UPI001785A60D|nr:Crp/Fnr family transcriptional regulator [Algoriphagus sp. Y33]